MLSSVVSDMYCYLELDKMDGTKTDWESIRDQCSAKRPAPMAPDAFEAMIRTGMELEKTTPGEGIKFTNGKDATAVVIPQYQQGFVRLMRNATYMAYANLGWGDAEMQTLAGAFEFAHANGAIPNLKTLAMQQNAIGDAGVSALATALESGALALLKVS